MGQPFHRSFVGKGCKSKETCDLLIQNVDGNARLRLLASDAEHGQLKNRDGVGDAGGVPGRQLTSDRHRNQGYDRLPDAILEVLDRIAAERVASGVSLDEHQATDRVAIGWGIDRCDQSSGSR